MTTYTPAQVAKVLHINADAVRQLIVSGELPASNVGQGKLKARYVVLETDLADFLERRKLPSSKPSRPRQRTKVTPKKQWV